MGDSIWEYLIVGGIFLVSAIQRHKISKILRQHKKTVKSKGDGGVTISAKCKKNNSLNSSFPPKSYAPCSDKF